ncbi:MAG: DUF1553 domain-containing protein, partial [Planctomycetaceae bacterium]|nr:DUF1553 domain-containing protein [Planctomycetaceae bacterium]
NETFFTEEDRSFWVFQPVKQAIVPQVTAQAWSKNPVDAFIYDRLKKEGLTPAGEADRTTLIRRAYYDLIGLPPTVEQINAFVNDPSPDAWQRLIDELLESPHYGEKWARHWLDVVRYAESDGFNQDAFRPEIWRYRDYVVRSFNSDKPYTQFVREQLAGDEIAPEDPDALAATGFLRHYLYEYNQRDSRTQWNDILDNITDATGDVFMGVSMGCARCHDHKFDPIPNQDYYRLRAFFAPLMPRDDVPFVTPQELAEYNQKLENWEKKTAAIRKQIDELTKGTLESAASSQIKMFPADLQEIMAKPEDERTALEHQLADLVLRQVKDKQNASLASLKKSEKPNGKKYNELLKELAAFDNLKPDPLPTGMSVTDSRGVAPVTTIPDDPEHRPVDPGFLSLLKPGEAEIMPVSTAPHSSGRRTALANWMVNPQNRLTTRVITNRVWQYHFGTGLVSTSNDFGHMGEAPSHPELLDWLAVEFMEHNWSMKQIHKLIVMSATYQQSAKVTPELLEADPYNKLYTRGPRLRLSAESIRDNALAISGLLSTKMGGPPIYPPQPEGLWRHVGRNAPKYLTSTAEDRYRRGVYVIWRRSAPYPSFTNFDAPDRGACVINRSRTNTPLQALTLLNDPAYVEIGIGLAKRLATKGLGTGLSDRERIAYAFRLCVAREAKEIEVDHLTKVFQQELTYFQEHPQAAQKLIPAEHRPEGVGASRIAAWLYLANILLNLDETITKG